MFIIYKNIILRCSKRQLCDVICTDFIDFVSKFKNGVLLIVSLIRVFLIQNIITIFITILTIHNLFRTIK